MFRTVLKGAALVVAYCGGAIATVSIAICVLPFLVVWIALGCDD